MRILTLLMIAIFIFLFSGCTPKVVTKIEYREPPKYDFQKINLDGVKLNIEQKKFNSKILTKKEVRSICTPSLINLNNIYKPIINFYNNEIDEYKSK